MGKNARYLLAALWSTLAVLGLILAVLAVLCALTGAGEGRANLFFIYYSMFPFYVLLVLYLIAYSLCTVNLNTALSLGTRRRDYFLALQSMFVLCPLVCWGLAVLAARLPELLRWEMTEQFGLLQRLGDPAALWPFPLVGAGLMVLGCLTGLVFVRSRLWGCILLVAVMLGMLTGIVGLALVSHAVGVEGAGQGTNLVVAGIALAVIAAGEIPVRRYIMRYSVM